MVNSSSTILLQKTLNWGSHQVCYESEEASARGVGGVYLGWEQPTLPAEGVLGLWSQSQVQNLGGAGSLLDKACPKGEDLGGGSQVIRSPCLKSPECAQKYCRAPCLDDWRCHCGNAEGHPELAIMVEAERQRRKIEFLHLKDASSWLLVSVALLFVLFIIHRVWISLSSGKATHSQQLISNLTCLKLIQMCKCCNLYPKIQTFTYIFLNSNFCYC